MKHIRELQRAAALGLDASLVFVVQMKGVQRLVPNDETHAAFGTALREAAANGVNVCAYDCLVMPDSLVMDQPVPVIL